MVHRSFRSAALAACAAALGACAPPAGPQPADRPIEAESAAARQAMSTGARAKERGDVPGAVAVLGDTTWEAPYRGGRGDARFTVACDPGWVAVGIHGRSGDQIHRVGLVCKYLHPDGTLRGEDF